MSDDFRGGTIYNENRKGRWIILKKYVVWTAGSLILLFLVICSFLFHPPKSEKAEEAVPLTLMMPQSHYKDFLADLLAEFEGEYPQIQIELQLIPDNQWNDVVKRKVLVKETPDIIRIDREVLRSVGTEYFVEMTGEEQWYDRADPRQIKSKMVDGKLYGLPLNTDSEFGVIYNREIFEEYGLEIPHSLEEFRKICQVLKENGITPLYVSDKDAWTVQIAFNSIAPQTVGEETWEQLRSCEISWSDVPQFREILADMYALRTDGYTNTDWADATYTGAVDAMAEGRAAMYINVESFVNDVKDINPQADLMMFPVPYEKDVLTVLDGQGQFSVFKDSKHIEEAKLFLNWFSQPGHMDIFTEGWQTGRVFLDQKQEIPEYQQVLEEKYIMTERTVLGVQDRFPGIAWDEFWNYQQAMYVGSMSPEEVFGQWDMAFSEQISGEEPGGM